MGGGRSCPRDGRVRPLWRCCGLRPGGPERSHGLETATDPAPASLAHLRSPCSRRGAFGHLPPPALRERPGVSDRGEARILDGPCCRLGPRRPLARSKLSRDGGYPGHPHRDPPWWVRSPLTEQEVLSPIVELLLPQVSAGREESQHRPEGGNARALGSALGMGTPADVPYPGFP